MADPPSVLAHEDLAEHLLLWWDRFGRKNLPWQRCRTLYRVYDLDVQPVFVRLRTRPAEVREGGTAGKWIQPGTHRLGLSTVAAKLLATVQSPKGVH